ncbi:dipeptidase [Robiginitomaculum antarcticum]|uniref:dipeptidase n=1 Tax=Robiginitomaculum antarcticum TaxID=437507 RepID=UPI00036A4215|nr:dipeptidase [Robiginitomaculum antarcticum]
MTFKTTLLATAALLMAGCGASDTPPADTAAPTPLTPAQIHDQILTLDTHIDIPLTYMTEIDPSGPTELQVDLPKLTEGRLDSGFWIVYTPQGELTPEGYAAAGAIAQTRLTAIEQLTQVHGADFELARTADDVRRIVSGGKHAVLIGMENAYPLGDSVADVPVMAARGVRYMGVTHFGHNQFGDSSNADPVRDEGPKWNGLSPLGRDLVAALNDNGIMVDVSHAGKATMMQAAEISRTPIIASHSGAKAVSDSLRNLDDEQLRKIRDVGGVAQMVALGVYVKVQTPEQLAALDALGQRFGISSRPDYEALSEEDKLVVDQERDRIIATEPLATVSDFVDHIDHAVKIAGIDHVGIASDFDGGGGIIGWKDASQTANVTAELLRRDYSEQDIAKIWGGNLLRVLSIVEADAK